MRAELPGAAGGAVAHSSLRFGDDRKYLLLFTSRMTTRITPRSLRTHGLAVRRGVLRWSGWCFCGLRFLGARVERPTR